MNPQLKPFLLSGALLLGLISPAKSTPLALTPGIAIAQSPTTQVAVDSFESLKKLLFNPQGGMVVGAIVTMMVLSWRLDSTGSKAKNRLATSRWAGPKEKSAARKKAHQQVNDRRANSVSLCIASPKLTYLPIARSKPNRATPTPIGQKVVKISQDNHTIWLPDAQRGLAVLGGPGSGKTHSVIDPALRSVIDQGFALVLYDFKYPTQSERIAGVAAKAGYQVRVFAPGFPESDVCNPLDFIRDVDDVDMARQIAIVLNRNFKPGTQSVEDPFFTNSGDQLIQAILLLAKSTPYPDIVTCAKALGADSLPARIKNAKLPTWIETSFGQLISMADSEKTVASVISTAAILFSRFMSPSILSVFCGKSTIPLDMEGKQLLILGMDRERRDVVAPLLATVMHMIITRNVTSKRRKDPLVVSLDELPTLFLPNLVQWLNENREDGLSCILGFQNMVQLEKAYGREISRAIFGGCGTKAIFNPQENESARAFSDYLGDEHLEYKTKSRSSGGGKTNTSISQQEKTRKLCAPEEFLRFPTGTCILINPGYSTKKETAIPLRLSIRIPKADLKRMDESQRYWEQVKVKLIDRSAQVKITDLEMQKRKDYFYETYPLPRKPDPNAEQTAKWGVANGFL